MFLDPGQTCPAAAGPGTIATGFIRSDDEDDSNHNSVGGAYAGSSVFLTADANTKPSLHA